MWCIKKLKEYIEEKLKYRVLIIYDISDDKARIKLSKYLSSYGTRVQKSAFEARVDRKQYLKLLEKLERFVCSEDSIRIYKFYENSEVITYGKDDEEIYNEIVII